MEAREGGATLSPRISAFGLHPGYPTWEKEWRLLSPCRQEEGKGLMMEDPILRQASAMRDLFHAALSDERLEPLVWRYAGAYRAFFQQFASSERFTATFDDDLKIRVSLKDHIESMIYFHEMQEGDRGLIRFLKRKLRPGMSFLDVGANIGFYTLIAAKRVGQSGYVYSFEPVHDTYMLLEENIRLNALAVVTTYRIALSGSPGRATVYVPRHANKGMASIHCDMHAAADPEPVIVDTMDRIVQSSGINRADIVKIDVEGSELAVIEGSIDTLQKFRPLVACELSRENLSRAGCRSEDIVASMESLGYDRFGLSEQGDLVTHITIRDHENLVFVPKDSQWHVTAA